MNVSFTTFIKFLSNKRNLSPAIITIILFFIVAFVTGSLIDDFELVTFAYLIIFPIIIVWNSIVFGKSWWERPNK